MVIKQKIFIILFMTYLNLYAYETLKNPVWEMNSKELYDWCVSNSFVTNEMILTGCKWGSQGKFAFIDKNGFLINRISLVDDRLNGTVAQTKSHLILGNYIFDKFESRDNLKIIKTLPYKFRHILVLGYDFIATDSQNVVRYFDRNLNIKYEIYQTDEIKSILKIDETLLVLVENEGLYKYDLKGNFIDKKEINVKFIDFLAFDDFFFTLEEKYSYQNFQTIREIKLIKYDYDGHKIFEKIVSSDSSRNEVKIVKFNENLLFITSNENGINLIEFNQNGDEIDKNIAYGYPKETAINTAVKLDNGDILLGGTINYNALFIKISADLPLGKQKIRPFDE